MAIYLFNGLMDKSGWTLDNFQNTGQCVDIQHIQYVFGIQIYGVFSKYTIFLYKYCSNPEYFT